MDENGVVVKALPLTRADIAQAASLVIARDRDAMFRFGVESLANYLFDVMAYRDATARRVIDNCKVNSGK